jgi:hypothetical protein
VGNLVSHRRTPFGLLKCKMTEIGHDQSQFLLMVGATVCFPGTFNEDNTEMIRVFSGQGAHGIRELVIGDKKPSATPLGRLPLFEFFCEYSHFQLAFSTWLDQGYS